MSDEENINSNKGRNEFSLPDDYFQKSANRILNKIEWDEEMNSYPNLMRLKNETVFLVPEKYFENNEFNLELLEFEKLISLKKISTFGLPKNYFEENAEIILFRILDEESDSEQNQNLNSIPKILSFKTPNNYFETNSSQITEALVPKKSAKIISISFSRIAFAAAAVIVVAIGFWMYQNYNQPSKINDCNTLACIEKRELLKSKQVENLDEDELFELVNTSKLKNHLNQIESTNKQQNKKDSSSKKSISEEVLDEI